MASELRFRPILASLVAFLVGCAAFVYGGILDLISVTVADDRNFDHRTRLHVDSMERELRASTIELTPLGERFKAFLRKRHAHRQSIGDGYLNGEAGWLPAH